MSAILEFHFRFRFRRYHRHRHFILHQGAKFYPNWSIGDGLWRHISFQDGGRQPCWICFGVMANHPRSVLCGLWSRSSNLLLVRFIVPEILQSLDFGVLAWSYLFMPLFVEFWEHISPTWRYPSTWPQKGPSVGVNTSFEPFSAA